MTESEEQEMHELAKRLVVMTDGTGWTAMQYLAIGRVMDQLTHYCATCKCQARRNGVVPKERAS